MMRVWHYAKDYHQFNTVHGYKLITIVNFSMVRTGVALLMLVEKQE